VGVAVNDFDWPPVPYAEYLQKELDRQTRYAYLNPGLDRRYDPVVVGGNAMHPVIQRGDVVLVDTGNTRPEDVASPRLTGKFSISTGPRSAWSVPAHESSHPNTMVARSG
jgi:hypothetical protein